jgi:hypothetical protein
MLRLGGVLAIATLLAAAGASAATITRHATTKSYLLMLSVGPLETMYTRAEVKTKHPTSGEVMLGGSMGHGMSMGAGNRHLEVQIRSLTTRKVVANAMPAISLRDMTPMGSHLDVNVPVVAMQGIGQGTADLHYGNNVNLTSGHLYQVRVTLDKQTASFMFIA